MTGAEIALICTVATAIVASIGLQAWRCSGNRENFLSDDNMTLDLESMEVNNGNKSLKIKNLKLKFVDIDKSHQDKHNTDARIGNKDVSMAMLGGTHGNANVESKSNEVGDSAFSFSSANHANPSSPTPQSPHKITPADLFQSFLGLVVSYVEYKDQGNTAQHGNDLSVPLIAPGDHPDHDVVQEV